MSGVDRAICQGIRYFGGEHYVFFGRGPLPFKKQYPGAAFILAFRALPLVLLMSALSALLYHWRILPWIVRGFA
jgi:CNT family concentrative nucleoside transporter